MQAISYHSVVHIFFFCLLWEDLTMSVVTHPCQNDRLWRMYIVAIYNAQSVHQSGLLTEAKRKGESCSCDWFRVTKPVNNRVALVTGLVSLLLPSSCPASSFFGHSNAVMTCILLGMVTLTLAAASVSQWVYWIPATWPHGTRGDEKKALRVALTLDSGFYLRRGHVPCLTDDFKRWNFYTLQA